jgi:hypothetical protein
VNLQVWICDGDDIERAELRSIKFGSRHSDPKPEWFSIEELTEHVVRQPSNHELVLALVHYPSGVRYLEAIFDNANPERLRTTLLALYSEGEEERGDRISAAERLRARVLASVALEKRFPDFADGAPWRRLIEGLLGAADAVAAVKAWEELLPAVQGQVTVTVAKSTPEAAQPPPDRAAKDRAPQFITIKAEHFVNAIRILGMAVRALSEDELRPEAEKRLSPAQRNLIADAAWWRDALGVVSAEALERVMAKSSLLPEEERKEFVSTLFQADGDQGKLRSILQRAVDSLNGKGE